LGIKLADLGMKWNEYDAAVKAVNEAKSVAGKAGDKSLVDKTNEKLKEVTLLKKEFDDYVKAEDGLSKITFQDTVNDPKKKADFERFNLIAGKWQCFKEDKWNIGIYMLPMGSDKDLAAIAQKEQKLFESKIPLTAENFYALAEDWYKKFDKKENDPRDKARYGSRALHWYEKTLETATGALKASAEARIKELGSLGGKGNIVDLLKMIDPAKDAVKGKWELKDGKLIAEAADVSKIEIPYQPPEEYDFRIKFTPTGVTPTLGQVLVKGDNSFVWAMGAAGNKWFGFDMIEGKSGLEHPSTIKKDNCLESGHTYTATVKVRRDQITGYLDDKAIVQLKTDGKNLSIHPSNALRNKSLLGFANYFKTSVTYHSIEVLEVSGIGKRIR